MPREITHVSQPGHSAPDVAPDRLPQAENGNVEAREARARRMSPGEPWPFLLEIRVPWRDVDAAGHVNNAVYFSYLEMARFEAYLRLLRGALGRNESFRGEALDPGAIDFIIAHQSCDYRSPAFLAETLVVKVWPGRVGSTSFTFRYEIREKSTDRLVAEAETVQVMYDWEADRKKPVPDGLRKLLEA